MGIEALTLVVYADQVGSDKERARAQALARAAELGWGTAETYDEDETIEDDDPGWVFTWSREWSG